MRSGSHRTLPALSPKLASRPISKAAATFACCLIPGPTFRPSSTRSAPRSRFYQEPDIVERTVRDFLTEEVDRVLIDNADDQARCQASVARKDGKECNLRVMVHPGILERLRSEDANLLVRMEREYGVKLAFRADPATTSKTSRSSTPPPAKSIAEFVLTVKRRRPRRPRPLPPFKSPSRKGRAFRAPIPFPSPKNDAR